MIDNAQSIVLMHHHLSSATSNPLFRGLQTPNEQLKYFQHNFDLVVSSQKCNAKAELLIAYNHYLIIFRECTYFLTIYTKVKMGTRRIYRGHGRKRRLKDITDTMVYVPLLKTLQILLQDEGIYTEVCMKHKQM